MTGLDLGHTCARLMPACVTLMVMYIELCCALVIQPLPSHARSWYGKEEWLSLEEFTTMVQSEDYRPLINCDSWQVLPIVWHIAVRACSHILFHAMHRLIAGIVLMQATSPLVFPSTRTGSKAVQSVQVVSQTAGSNAAQRSHTFTFCLEHVTEGPYKVSQVTIRFLCC